MEKVMPLVEYEPLVLFPKPKISDEEEDRRDMDGVRPLGTRIIEEPRNFRGGKDSHEREAIK
jgi:hypothetical protein